MTINAAEHVGLAHAMTRRFVLAHPLLRRHEPDLLGEAYLGLVKAASDFDPARGFKFSTLAGCYISNHLSNFVTVERRATRADRFADIDVEPADRRNQFAEADIRIDVTGALRVAALAARHRTLLRRVYFDGEAQVDVAAELSVTRQGIHYHHRRATNRVKEHLMAYADETEGAA